MVSGTDRRYRGRVNGLPHQDTTVVIELRVAALTGIAPAEPLPRAIRRMSIHLLDGAISDLKDAGVHDADTGIHAARKKMKRLRGILRLIRDDLGQRTYRQENVVLRDIGRSIGAVRDARVLVLTLRTLRDDYAGLLDPTAFAATERWLEGNHRDHVAAAGRGVITDAIVSLAAARSRFSAFDLARVVADDFDAIAPGLARVYHRGHRAHRRSASTRSVEDLHEWRKRVKYLWYQMEALEPIQPILIGAMAHELETLGELLGVDHDLAVLAATVSAEPAACSDQRERALLTAAVDERRGTLQEEAFRMGDALYGEDPDEFVHRLGSYWRAGRR